MDDISLSAHEKTRLHILKNYQILDSPTEQAFDELTELAAVICNAPIASISFVDADRLWFKSIIGIQALEAPRVHSFCGHAVQQDGLFVVKDAKLDDRFAQNPLVKGDLGVRFYAGQPLLSKDGYALGTICVLDTKPRELSEQQSKALEHISHQIALQLQHRFDLIRLDHMGQLLDKTSSMAKVGGWELDIATRELYWTNEIYSIHEVDNNFTPTVELALSFYRPEDQEKLKAVIKNAMEKGGGWDFELPFTTAKQNEIWVRAQGQAIFNGNKAVRLVGAFQDITEQKVNQIKLSWVNRALNLLRYCNQSLLQVKHEHQLVAEICKLIVQEGGYSFAWVGAVDMNAGNHIIPLGFYGNGESYLQENQLCWTHDTKIGNGPCGMAIRSGNLVRNDDIQTSHSEHTQLLKSYGYSSIVSLPLKNDNDEVFGLLAIYSSQEHQHASEEISLITNLAQNVAAGIIKIRKDYERRKISLAVSKLAKALSAVSNDNFFEELVFNMVSTLNADAGYVARLLFAPKMRLQTLSVVVNNEVEPNFEYLISDELSKALFDEDSVKFVRAGAFEHPVFKHMSLMRHYPYEAFAGFRLDNSKKEHCGLIFVFFKNKLSEDLEHLVRSTISIFASRTSSELERIEDALIIQERAALMDKSHDPMVVRDLNHKVTYWNHAAEMLYGWTEAEALNANIDQLLKIDIKEFTDTNKQILEYGEWFGERVEYHKDGHPMVIEAHATLVRDKFGEPRSVFSIKKDITGKKVEENEIRKLAYFDALTHLPNRRLLTDRLVNALNAVKENGKIGAIFFIDLDKFKNLNDAHGHDEGDLLLQQVASRLSKVVRDSDTVARLGGDEFVVLIEGITADKELIKEIVTDIAEKIIKAFLFPFELKTTLFSTSPSIGIRLFNNDDNNLEVIIKDADAAMYESKKNGRNKYTFS